MNDDPRVAVTKLRKNLTDICIRSQLPAWLLVQVLDGVKSDLLASMVDNLTIQQEDNDEQDE